MKWIDTVTVFLCLVVNVEVNDAKPEKQHDEHNPSVRYTREALSGELHELISLWDWLGAVIY